MTLLRMDNVLIVVEDLEATKAFFLRMQPADPPANALGIRRVMFAVDDIDDLVERLRRRHSAELVGEMAQ
jgi:D-mannonate dehydratase